MYQLITIVAGGLNLILCLDQVRQALKRLSFTFLIWLFATVFAMLAVIEGLIAPVYLSAGSRAFQIQPATVAKACAFMLLFNLLMAISAYYVRRPLGLSTRQTRVFSDCSFPRELKVLTTPITLIFTVAALIYLKRVAGYAIYSDRYRDGGSAWELVIMVACWSAVSFAIVFRQKLALLYFICAGAILTYATGVRYFALFFIVPILVFYFLQGIANSQVGEKHKRAVARRYVVLSVAAVLVFAAFAQFVFHTRAEIRVDADVSLRTHHIEELWLLKGFYVIVDSYDNESEPFRFTNYRRMLDGLMFPYYCMFDREHAYPLDPPVMFAHIVGNYDLNDTEHFQHWPMLLYADAYAAFRFWGCLLGLFWGLTYTLLDYLLSKPSAFPFVFPYAMWFFYMTFRGAVSNSIVSIPREIYINGGLMCICYLAVWRKPQRMSALRVEGAVRLPVKRARGARQFGGEVTWK